VKAIAYRFKQFWQNVAAPPLSDGVLAEVAAHLTPAEMALFRRFDRSDGWHSYRVLCTLQEAGHSQPDLLAAALLHDVGKTCAPLTVWERSLIVVAQWVWPDKTAVWGQGALTDAGWKRPFVVKAQHAAWGAQMAAAAGSHPLTVELIRRHQDEELATAVAEAASEVEYLLRLLQWADDQN
jgi:hypothetical protein